MNPEKLLEEEVERIRQGRALVEVTITVKSSYLDEGVIPLEQGQAINLVAAYLARVLAGVGHETSRAHVPGSIQSTVWVAPADAHRLLPAMLDMVELARYRQFVLTQPATLRDTIIEMIAAACHQQNKAWCEAHGDTSQVDWADAPDWQRSSAIDGVKKALEGATPEQSHENWCAGKLADGWTYGPVKDPAAKTHPCMVPYAELPDDQKRKDHLFIAMVNQLSSSVRAILTAEPTT